MESYWIAIRIDCQTESLWQQDVILWLLEPEKCALQKSDATVNIKTENI